MIMAVKETEISNIILKIHNFFSWDFMYLCMNVNGEKGHMKRL